MNKLSQQFRTQKEGRRYLWCTIDSQIDGQTGATTPTKCGLSPQSELYSTEQQLPGQSSPEGMRIPCASPAPPPVYIYIYIYTYMLIYMYAYIYIYVNINTDLHIYTYIYLYSWSAPQRKGTAGEQLAGFLLQVLTIKLRLRVES